MGLLSPQQVLDLKTELAKPIYQGKSNAEKLDLVNAPSQVPNPRPKKVHPDLATYQTAITNMLSPASREKLALSGYMPSMISYIKADSRAELANGLNFITGALIEPTEAANLRTLLSQTVDDPTWTEFVTGDTPFQQIAGLGDVPIVHADGHSSVGTCYLTFIEEALA